MSTDTAEALLERVTTFQRREIRRRYLAMIMLIAAWAAVVAIEAVLISRLETSRKQLVRDNGALLKSRDALATTTSQLTTAIGLKQAELAKLDDQLKAASVSVERRHGHKTTLDELIAKYDWALATDKNNAVLYNLKGYALFRRGDLAAALDNLRKSTSLSPNYVWGHYNLALALWASGDHRAAVDEVRRVVSLDRSFISIILDDGQFREFHADAAFNRALEPAPVDARVYLTVSTSTSDNAAREIMGRLNAANFSVVATSKAASTLFGKNDEVVYYSDADRVEANQLAVVVHRITNREVRIRLSANSGERSRHYDVWARPKDN